MGSSALTTVRSRTLFAPLDAGGRAETVARRLVGWQPTTTLSDGLAQSIDYFRKYKAHYW